MLDAVQIFTKGGLVLFSWSLGMTTLKGNPVDALIRTQLLEERGGGRVAASGRLADQATVLLFLLLVQIGGRKESLESLGVILRILNDSPESTGNRPQGIEDARVPGQPE